VGDRYVMELGMHHPMGPLKLADFIGLDVCSRFSTSGTRARRLEIIAVPVTAADGRGRQLGRKSGQGFYTY